MGYSACKEGESGGKIGSAIVDGSFGYTRVYRDDSHNFVLVDDPRLVKYKFFVLE